MIRSTRRVPAARLAFIATALAMLSACASTPTTAVLAAGQQATIEGHVVGVDTAPWAYDGNAVITVATTTAGTVKVQLPARWNRCKAQPLDDVQALKSGDRVQAVGTVIAADALMVCEQPQHRLNKVE
ncbi:hypothetical protein ACFPOA_02500 [Lysobacter niabensis]|uniref:hypothetical protein n=1 Tax=Agrilutibacter niabensis TaxID=380628 RepID=UPI00361143E6